jgi:hypothetical protein
MLAPFAETSAQVWEILRQESNAELGPITLEGSGPQRKVALDVVIDDPVQSMDPAKVDGLAHVLSHVARTRQVVVFTHDDRLPSAVRQPQLPATVWAGTRRERSVVALKKNDDLSQGVAASRRMRSAIVVASSSLIR